MPESFEEVAKTDMISALLRRKIAGCCCRDAIKSLKKSSVAQIVARTKMNVTSTSGCNDKNEFRPIAFLGNESMVHESRGSMGHWLYLQKNLGAICHLAALKRNFTTNSFIKGINLDKSDLLSELNDSLCPIGKKPLQLFSVIDRDYMSIDDVIQILNESLCEDLCVIKIDDDRTKFHYVDYLVIVSGRSLRHLKSMAFEICAKVIKAKIDVGVIINQGTADFKFLSFSKRASN